MAHPTPRNRNVGAPDGAAETPGPLGRDPRQSEASPGLTTGAGIGAALGIALGVAFGKLALGISLGVAVGVALGLALEDRGSAE